MIHTVESNFLNFVIEYLGEIETEFKNTLACLLGAQIGSNHEKKWRSKISWHTPFNINIPKMAFYQQTPLVKQIFNASVYWNLNLCYIHFIKIENYRKSLLFLG